MNNEEIRLEPPKRDYGGIPLFAGVKLVLNLAVFVYVVWFIFYFISHEDVASHFVGLAAFSLVITISGISYIIQNWGKHKENYRYMKMTHYFNTKVNQYLKKKYDMALDIHSQVDIYNLINGRFVDIYMSESEEDEDLVIYNLYNGSIILDYADGKINNFDSSNIALTMAHDTNEFIELDLKHPTYDGDNEEEYEKSRRVFPEQYDLEKMVRDSIQSIIPQKHSGNLTLISLNKEEKTMVVEFEVMEKSSNGQSIYDENEYEKFVAHQVDYMKKDRISVVAVGFCDNDRKQYVGIHFTLPLETGYLDKKSAKITLKTLPFIRENLHSLDPDSDFEIVTDNSKFN